jgi:hypothetical protein
MEDISEKSRLDKESVGGSGTKDHQCPGVERSPIQPQASGLRK